MKFRELVVDAWSALSHKAPMRDDASGDAWTVTSGRGRVHLDSVGCQATELHEGLVGLARLVPAE